MRSRIAVLLVGALLVSCGSKEELSDDEMEYVDITLALLRARTTAQPRGADTTNIDHALNQVYARYNTSANGYREMTQELAEDPFRADLVHRAVKDSLGIK